MGLRVHRVVNPDPDLTLTVTLTLTALTEVKQPLELFFARGVKGPPERHVLGWTDIGACAIESANSHRLAVVH